MKKVKTFCLLLNTLTTRRIHYEKMVICNDYFNASSYIGSLWANDDKATEEKEGKKETKTTEVLKIGAIPDQNAADPTKRNGCCCKAT